MAAAKKDTRSGAKTNAAPVQDEVLSEKCNLYAKTDILYESHQYNMGDELPADKPDMVEAWLRAETAEWR